MGIFVPIRAQKCRKNQKGQVAIFVALIFQVLFLFFAMVVNVGLLVHHKINLQNSVDLAAYYGAMKQAELLNVIAHSNYQIRQSWKLLAWRYRVLGTAGVMEGDLGANSHPFNKVSKQVDDNDESDMSQLKEFYDSPPFCVTFIPFKPMPKDENTCRKARLKDTVRLPTVPKTYWSFTKITGVAKATTISGNKAAQQRCYDFGSINYSTLGRFIVSYSIDQAQRKRLISALANNMSKDQNEFLDIDGNSVKEGAFNTLANNLTDANRAGLSRENFKIYNSLKNDSCGQRNVANRHPKWLSEIRISPGFGYKDTNCRELGGGNVEFDTEAKAIENSDMPPGGPPRHADKVKGDLKNLVDSIIWMIPTVMNGNTGNEFYPYHASVGFEKDPWCEVYVGVKATSSPKIPFSLGEVNLEARAFAKPFGGSVGPWYYNRFPKSSGEGQSANGERIDPLLPLRFADAASQGQSNDKSRITNYSRYPGDKLGLQAKSVLGVYAKSIYFMDNNWANSVTLPTENLTDDGAPNFNHWVDLERDFKEKKEWDILAWDANASGDPTRNRMRLLELSALAPDIFDLTYYSIEPNYYQMYGERLGKGIANIAAYVGADYVDMYGPIGVRGDLGARLSGESYQSFSGKPSKNIKYFNVEDQVDVAREIKNWPGGRPVLVTNNDKGKDFKYLVNKFTHLLTWWTSEDFLDYSFNQKVKEKFGHCTTEPTEGIPAPGNCLYGGRTGYSVKLISEDFLYSRQPAGGQNSGEDYIKNPPEDF